MVSLPHHDPIERQCPRNPVAPYLGGIVPVPTLNQGGNGLANPGPQSPQAPVQVHVYMEGSHPVQPSAPPRGSPTQPGGAGGYYRSSGSMSVTPPKREWKSEDKELDKASNSSLNRRYED